MKQVKSKKWRATLSYRVDDSEVTNVLKKPSEIDNAIRQGKFSGFLIIFWARDVNLLWQS